MKGAMTVTEKVVERMLPLLSLKDTCNPKTPEARAVALVTRPALLTAKLVVSLVHQASMPKRDVAFSW